MPPWHADPRYGHFSNDRGLTARQRATLLAWVEQGTPLGDPEARACRQDVPRGVGDRHPRPRRADARAVRRAGPGVVKYQHFRVPTGFTEDRWIQAAEARPGDRAIVHHIGVYVDDHDPKSSAAEPQVKHVVALYFPGENSPVFPPGIARRIPAGSDLIFEVHYTPIGVAKTDVSSVGMIFAREPVGPRGPDARDSRTRTLRIPPGAASHPVRSSYTFPSDAHLLT